MATFGCLLIAVIVSAASALGPDPTYYPLGLCQSLRNGSSLVYVHEAVPTEELGAIKSWLENHNPGLRLDLEEHAWEATFSSMPGFFDTGNLHDYMRWQWTLEPRLRPVMPLVQHLTATVKQRVFRIAQRGSMSVPCHELVLWNWDGHGSLKPLYDCDETTKPDSWAICSNYHSILAFMDHEAGIGPCPGLD